MQRIRVGNTRTHLQTSSIAGYPLINIRPRQNNRSLEILDPDVRNRVAQIAQLLLGAYGSRIENIFAIGYAAIASSFSKSFISVRTDA